MQQSKSNTLLDIIKKWLAALGFGGLTVNKVEGENAEPSSQIASDDKYAVRVRRPTDGKIQPETNKTMTASTPIPNDDDDEPPEHTMDQQHAQQAKNENVNDLRPPMPGGAKKKVIRHK